MIDYLLLGFQVALAPENLVYCFLGVFLGTFVGALPGIGAFSALSMLLPITFHLDPTSAMIMLAGVYYGSEYGGSTASILLNLPGSPSNAITCLDGFPMARAGRAGVALFITTIASFVGGTLSIVVLIALTPALASLALSFGPADYFAAMLFGLVAAASVAAGGPVKGMAMVVFGLLLGCIGADVNTGVPRFTLGFPELLDGISLAVIAMGLFGLPEMMRSINLPQYEGFEQKIRLRDMLPTRDDIRRSVLPILRGSAIGSFFGALPGTGATISTLFSYAAEKRLARDPSRFGKGAIEGIASPEASNNAAVQTAFIPTLALGVPGTATMAIMLGALIIHGIPAGPFLITRHPDLFWGVVASFWIGNLILVVLNIPFVGLWVRILKIPYRFLFPTIIALICIGVFSVSNSLFDLWALIAIGISGYFLRHLGFEAAPALIGYVLGPMVEENFRRSMVMSRGDFTVFVESPVSAIFLACCAAMLLFGAAVRLWRIRSGLRMTRQARAAP